MLVFSGNNEAISLFLNFLTALAVAPWHCGTEVVMINIFFQFVFFF